MPSFGNASAAPPQWLSAPELESAVNKNSNLGNRFKRPHRLEADAASAASAAKGPDVEELSPDGDK